jgi:hypothetical protein
VSLDMLKFKTVSYYQPRIIKELKSNVFFIDALEKSRDAELSDEDISKILTIETYKIISMDTVLLALVNELIMLEFDSPNNIKANQVAPFEVYIEYLQRYFERSRDMNEYIERMTPQDKDNISMQKNRSINGIILEWSHLLLSLMQIGFSKGEAEAYPFYEAIKLLEAKNLTDQINFNNSILGQAYSAGNIKGKDLRNGIKTFQDL